MWAGQGRGARDKGEWQSGTAHGTRRDRDLPFCSIFLLMSKLPTRFPDRFTSARVVFPFISSSERAACAMPRCPGASVATGRCCSTEA